MIQCTLRLPNLWDDSIAPLLTDKQDKITRSPAEARQIIEAHIKHLQSLSGEQRNAEFAKIASTESDCSSAKKGGDLGWFGKGMMQKSFEVSWSTELRSHREAASERWSPRNRIAET
jgi:hypothetical protein